MIQTVKRACTIKFSAPFTVIPALVDPMPSSDRWGPGLM